MLCIASGLSILQVPGEQVCYAYARHHRLAVLVLSEGLLNVGMSLALASTFGIIGVAMATLLASVIHRGVLLPLYVLRLIEINRRQYLLTLLPVFVLSLGAQSMLYAATLYVRFSSLIELMLVTGFVYSCLGLALIRFGLSRREREILTSVAPFARKVLL
jgi:peptidoglycan biosynthesis protein MviN/MurJ (putative lipid II flippase)